MVTRQLLRSFGRDHHDSQRVLVGNYVRRNPTPGELANDDGHQYGCAHRFTPSSVYARPKCGGAIAISAYLELGAYDLPAALTPEAQVAGCVLPPRVTGPKCTHKVGPIFSGAAA